MRVAGALIMMELVLGSAIICTDGFDEDAVKILAKYLEKVWQVKSTVAPIKKLNGKKDKYYRIWLSSTSELIKFLQIILPHMEVEEMLSKVILLYKNDQLQERWISEIASHTKFSLDTIRKYVNLKKDKWQAYRK